MLTKRSTATPNQPIITTFSTAFMFVVVRSSRP